MFEKLLRFFTKERDTLVFQVSEEFIEVTALRQDADEVKRHGGLCLTETLYTKRVPIGKPSSKKVLDELAKQVGELANVAVSSRELLSKDFDIKEAKVACVLVAPISASATTVYEAELPEQTKVNTRLLASVADTEHIVEDTLKSAPKDYAIYLDEVLSVELNGYNTHKPLGKSATTVRLTVAKYLVEPKVWQAVGAVLESTFHRDIKYIHAQSELDVTDTEFCNEIYTATELQAITNVIL